MVSRTVELDELRAAGLALDIAEVHLALDELDAAWAWAGRLVERDRLASPPWVLPIAPVVARIIARRRERDGDPTLQAQDVARLHAVIARDAWPTRPLWEAFAIAEVGGASGAGDDVELWQAALAAAERPETPVLTRLQLLRGLGRAQLRSGDRGAAADTLGHLGDEAAALCAGLLVTQATQLIASGGLATPTPGSDADELTARELQVLELVAEGLSNGQIAERLYISRKTVSVRVSAILRKLGATSRTEATRRHLSG